MPKQNARVMTEPAHIAAPIGGWNNRSAIADMPPTDAVVMDNLFPETSGLRLRRGSQTYASVVGGYQPIQSLMTYRGTGGERLLGAVGGAIGDFTDPANISGIVTAAGRDTWEYVNFATPGGQFWIGVNAGASVWVWAGPGSGNAFRASNTGDASIPSGGPSPFAMITAFQSRLFFCSENDRLLYYLPPNVFQGELHAMDLGSLLTRGGSIAFLSTWTRDDSTLGMNDLLVIGTTQGEILTYRGINPDDPENWFLAGRFEVGFPVTGHRQIVRVGPDMMLINSDGFQALSDYITMGESKALTTALSMKIGNAVTQAMLQNPTGTGWCAILYPAKNALLVNIPVAGGFQQFVVNTVTGAWCRFTNLNAWCWTLFNGGIYFGADDATVVQADIGGTDNGAPIPFDLVTAFQTGQNLTQKRAVMCRPFIIGAGRFYPVMDVNVDYMVEPVTSTVAIVNDQTTWDQFDWDEANWGTAGQPQHYWYSVEGVGMAFAIRFSGQAYSANLQLLAFDLAFETGVGLV